MNDRKEPGVKRRGNAKRIGLTALATAAILAFAAIQTDAVSLIPGVRQIFVPRSTKLNVPILPGSKLLRSYEASFNGHKSKFAHYTSRISPNEVIRRYREMASKPGRTICAALPGTIVRRRDQAMIAYRDADGTTVGIVAFANTGGGCTYFIGRSMPARPPRKGLDVPGREPPDVPKPYRSTRVMCMENLAGLPSIISMYEGWGGVDDSIGHIRHSMESAGWLRNSDVEDVVGGNLGGTVLSYTRGVENCFIHLEVESRTNHVMTMMFYSRKPWLPSGRGF